MTDRTATLSKLERDVIQIAKEDARGRSWLAGPTRSRQLANPRLEALRRYAVQRFGATTGVAADPQAIIGYDCAEQAVVDAWIEHLASPRFAAHEARVRYDRRATIAGIGMGLVSILGFAGLNLVLLFGYHH